MQPKVSVAPINVQINLFTLLLWHFNVLNSVANKFTNLNLLSKYFFPLERNLQSADILPANHLPPKWHFYLKNDKTEKLRRLSDYILHLTYFLKRNFKGNKASPGHSFSKGQIIRPSRKETWQCVAFASMWSGHSCSEEGQRRSWQPFWGTEYISNGGTFRKQLSNTHFKWKIKLIMLFPEIISLPPQIIFVFFFSEQVDIFPKETFCCTWFMETTFSWWICLAKSARPAQARCPSAAALPFPLKQRRSSWILHNANRNGRAEEVSRNTPRHASERTGRRLLPFSHIQRDAHAESPFTITLSSTPWTDNKGPQAVIIQYPKLGPATRLLSKVVAKWEIHSPRMLSTMQG